MLVNFRCPDHYYPWRKNSSQTFVIRSQPGAWL
jgi:hypothetical protein